MGSPELEPNLSISTQVEPDELLRGLQNPALYDHPVKNFSVIETHISWVLLTGVFAYKIKKPVNLGFLDFSSLEKRRRFCTEELRLNRRFAPDLYMQVVTIKGNPAQPRLLGAGKAIEFAVKMREFPQHNLLSTHAADHRLEAKHIDSMGNVIAGFHSVTRHAESKSEWGTVSSISKWVRENFDQIESALPKNILPSDFKTLKKWSLSSNDTRLAALNERKTKGFVRECHGDLHLGNVVLIDGRITLFDCIEFNEELRWIDTISEVAFVAMDLCARGYPKFSRRFINGYLQSTGDYEGIALLRYYFVYRALVRAKVEALRAQQSQPAAADQTTIYQVVSRYLDLAKTWSKNIRPTMIIMHGLSGSGKSTVAKQLVETLGAIQIRSDVERKRLFGLNPFENSRSCFERQIYTADAGKQTYHRLADLARTIIQAGYTVIVDGAFLKLPQRNQFKQLAQQCNAPYLFATCEAPVSVLRDRIKHRIKSGTDPSEATLDVLEYQLQSYEALTEEERGRSFTVSSSNPNLSAEQLRTLIRQISKADSSL